MPPVCMLQSILGNERGFPPSPLFCRSTYNIGKLGGWVNPHREQHTIPQGQTSSPTKYFFTPTAKARPDQVALATSAEARGATHRARPRSRVLPISCIGQVAYLQHRDRRRLGLVLVDRERRVGVLEQLHKAAHPSIKRNDGVGSWIGR